MSANNRFSFRRSWPGQRWLLILPGLGLLGEHRLPAASSVIASQPAPPVVPQVTQDSPPGVMDVFTPAPANVLPSLFRCGPVTLHPHFGYSFSYGDGIQSSPGNSQKTIIQTVSPGILFALGTHWALDYTPSLQFYSSSEFQNTVSHSISLSGATYYEDWSFGLAQGVSISSSPTVETGTQTDQQSYTTSLSASRSLGSQMSADLGVSQALNYASGAGTQNSSSWSTMDWLNYSIATRLNVGVGVGGGYTIADLSDQTDEQLQGRINWRATDKISFQLSGGGEADQITGDNSENQINPIYSATIQYQPFNFTQLSLSASRATSASVLVGQNTDTTSLSLGLNQRLFQKFQLGVTGGYSQTSYAAAGIGISTSRMDENYSANVSLSHPFLQRGTWSVFYSYSDNVSSEPGLSYASNQVGFSLSYSY